MALLAHPEANSPLNCDAGDFLSRGFIVNSLCISPSVDICDAFLGYTRRAMVPSVKMLQSLQTVPTVPTAQDVCLKAWGAYNSLGWQRIPWMTPGLRASLASTDSTPIIPALRRYSSIRGKCINLTLGFNDWMSPYALDFHPHQRSAHE